MSENPYEEALQKAQEELAKIEERREILLKTIQNLKALSGDELWELSPPPGYEPEGMTAEIRKILNLTLTHLNATQIRDALIQRGFNPTSKPKNLLIAVHTVLSRIENELDVIERDGKPAYKAKPTNVGMFANLGMVTDFTKTLETVRKQYDYSAMLANYEKQQKDLYRKISDMVKTYNLAGIPGLTPPPAAKVEDVDKKK
jgi:hypothetical protein